MNLPKYIPGLIVVANDEKREFYPEGFGMFVIANAFIDHEEWHYENYDGKIQFHESEIVAVINNGYYVASDRFKGVEMAPERAPEVTDELESMMSEPTPEEEAFIKKHSKRTGAKKSKKIEVKDGDKA